MFFLYTLLFYLGIPFILLRLCWRSRDNVAYRQRMAERFGFYSSEVHPADIWLHAASLGEVIALSPLIESLLPQYSLVLTTMTPSGSAEVGRRFAGRLQHVYVPYDLPLVQRSFLRHFKPRCLLLMETEIWPNMIRCAKAKGLLVAMINARLSDKSFQSYRKVAFAMRPVLRQLDWVLAKSEEDAHRMVQIGAIVSRVQVGVNIKFAHNIVAKMSENEAKIDKHDDKIAEVKKPHRPIWLAASTHEDEEMRLLTVHRQLQKIYPTLLLIVVPRHVSRCGALAKQIQATGCRLMRSVSVDDVRESEADVCLVERMGVLCDYYTVADIAFVGGSWVPRGGHNLIEAASAQAVVLSGPHLSNFVAVRDLLCAANAMQVVEDESALFNAMQHLLANPQDAQAYRDRANAVLRAQRDKALQPIQDWLHDHLLSLP